VFDAVVKYQPISLVSGLKEVLFDNERLLIKLDTWDNFTSVDRVTSDLLSTLNLNYVGIPSIAESDGYRAKIYNNRYLEEVYFNISTDGNYVIVTPLDTLSTGFKPKEFLDTYFFRLNSLLHNPDIAEGA